MTSKYAQDLSELIAFALTEYRTCTLRKNDLTESGYIQKTFGSLIANVSMITADRNRLYLRRYDVRSLEGNYRLSFILGHAAMLFGVSSRKFREELLHTEKIKGVVTLKQSVFEQIIMPAAIIVLNNDEADTWFTSAESMEVLTDLLTGKLDNSRNVYHSTNVSPENLLPEFYNGDDAVIAKSFEGTQTKTLAEVAEIIAGKGAKREDFADHGLPYLRARDIQNGKILQPDLFISQEKAECFAKQLIQEGDILLTKFFGQNKLALVTEADGPAIVSNALFIIRPFDVSEGYLYQYLTSKTGNEIFSKQLGRVQKGVTVPSITLADLKKIVVPIFEPDIMQSLERIGSISNDEAVRTVKRLMHYVTPGSVLERDVINALISSGWNEADFVGGNDAWISIDTNRRWCPDYIYHMPDGRKAIIEVKSGISAVRQDWVHAVKHILDESNNYIFILSTGSYYEVHISGKKQSLKLMRPPTISQILDWEKEVH